MKIGILTLPPQINYGGILQAYALQEVLKNEGHEVEIFKRRIVGETTIKCSILRCVKKYLLHKPVHIRWESDTIRWEAYESKNLVPFFDKYLNLRFIHSLKDIKESDYDGIVVGSDQIWRSSYFKFSFKTSEEDTISIVDAFLHFANGWNLKRVAYAASFGLDSVFDYSNDEIASCSQQLKLFDGVSVREETARDLCKKVFHAEALHVLDPTFLLKKEDYYKLFEKESSVIERGTAITYILNETPDKIESINWVCNELTLKSFNVYNANKDLQPKGIEYWLKAFYDADFVITDSFHGCVFAIIMEKPFYVLANEERGMSRFLSLLSLFHLEDRLLKADRLDLPKKEISMYVDYEKVRTIINTQRAISLSFLKGSLLQ